MASYQNPQVTNPILDDINTIRELIKYNAKLDPSLGEGLESGMIRLADVSGGKQFQIYNGSSWAKIGKLINDADTLDGKHLSTSAVKDTIPMYNNSAMLVGSITGNAVTATKLETVRTIDLGGQVVATAQSFDGSANITIPITQLLVNNDTDTAVKGALTPLHGGTGRTDGASLDVVVDSLAGQVKASAYGQIGRAKQITSSTDFNTLVVDGNYTGYASVTVADNNAPDNYTNTVISVRVTTYGDTVIQIMTVGSVLTYTRQSVNGGASWAGWTSIGGTKATVTIYVSKSGSDNNTGYDSAYPVATIDKAIQIAKGAIPRASNGSVKLCIGEGNWGSVTFDSLPFTIHVYPFSGSSATEYSTSLPVFTLISAKHSKVTVCSVVSTTLDAYNNGYLSIGTGYKKTSCIRARYSGILELASQNNTTNILDIFNSDITSPVIDAYYRGEIVIGDYQHILLADNINRIFLQANHLSKIHCYASRITFDSTDAVNSGQKFQCFAGSSISTYEDGSNTLPTFLTSTLPGSGYTIEKGAIVNGIPYGTAMQSDLTSLSDDIANNYLKLSGGTMTGSIKLSYNGVGGELACSDFNSEYHYVILSATGSNAANFQAFRQDSPLLSGAFICRAMNATGSLYDLVGRNDGTLTWAGKNIVRTVNGNGADADGNVTSIPSGTKMLFNQAAAPTGWTKQTSVSDATLRVVSGDGGGTGGSIAFSTLFTAGKSVSLSGNVGSTTITTNTMPSHTHGLWIYRDGSSEGVRKAAGRGDGTNPNTNATGGSQAHTHSLAGSATISLDVKYTDVIICSKD